MELFKLFSSKSPNKVFISLILGVLAGISYAILIPIVMASIDHRNDLTTVLDNTIHIYGLEISNYRFALIFVAVCSFILLSRTLSQIFLSRVALDATTALRVKAYQHIVDAPVAELEKIGSSKLITAITTDVARIIMGATVIPNVLVSAVTLAGMLCYIYILNDFIFWFVVKALVFGVITYQIPMFIGNKYFERGRSNFDALQEAIRGLIYGVKELKLNADKRRRYFEDILLSSEYSVLNNGKRANTIVVAAANYGDLLSFFVIGVVAYIFVSYHAIGADKLIGSVMVLLYITGPVALILNAMPQVANARVSLRRVNALFEKLDKEGVAKAANPMVQWDAISLSEVCYVHNLDGSSFKLGPVNLEIRKGWTTFIVGGNGSGKSTLSKLISLHYTASEGGIYFGDTLIDKSSTEAARQHISSIFTDYYLFDRLLIDMDSDQELLVNNYLKKFELDKKVSVVAGRFSTTALSDGQRKRLALLVAFLEDRELYIFDEWAADQDPIFKRIFYNEILPELRARNKAVVVISHDDRYFHVADCVFVMEDGQLVRTEYPRRDSLAGQDTRASQVEHELIS
jgi:putative ATP-binding cassette transporter